MGWMFNSVGRLIGPLRKPVEGYEPFRSNDSTALRDILRSGDVLLVDGNNHIFKPIKNLSQALEAVGYPILPMIRRVERRAAACEIDKIRHSSLYTPRDFDISPYFMVVKPTLARDFNYEDMHWADLPYLAKVHAAQLTLVPAIEYMRRVRRDSATIARSQGEATPT